MLELCVVALGRELAGLLLFEKELGATGNGDASAPTDSSDCSLCSSLCIRLGYLPANSDGSR